MNPKKKNENIEDIEEILEKDISPDEEPDEIDDLDEPIDIDEDDDPTPKKVYTDDYDDFDDDFSDDNYDDDDRFDVIYSLNTNKHKQDGKHSLERDTIFKGKLEEKSEEGFGDSFSTNTSSKIETGSLYEFESRYHADYINQKNISKDVFDVLDQQTELNYKQNRRKPNKQTFNEYYELLIRELGRRYTNYEIFVELSFYFTDNIFNMFKLLDKKHALYIIKELKVRGYLRDLDNLNFV